MARVLDGIANPGDLRALGGEDLATLASEIRDLLVNTVARTSGHLGPTVGGLAEHLAGLRLKPGYERMLGQVKGALGRTPVVGQPIYDALHGVKRGIKDMLQPQGMFEDLGLKYFGPIDGHDVAAVEHALRLARGFDGPVIVHCVTRKGYGYAPAENDEADQMHQSGCFDPATGLARPSTGRPWTG